MQFVVIGLALVVFAAGPFQITDTQRGVYEAELVRIEGQTATLRKAGGEFQVPLNQLLNLRPSLASELEAVDWNALVRLRDGTRLQCASLSSDGSTAQLQLHAGKAVSVPAAQLRSIQFQELSEDQQSQWQAIMDSRLSADMLILVRSPQALDTAEGVITAMNDEAVKFDFGGQIIDAPLSKLAGVRIFSAEAAARNADNESSAVDELLAVVHDTHGNVWPVGSLSAPGGDGIAFETAGGIAYELPWDRVYKIDFSAGSMQYLASLSPLLSEANGLSEVLANIDGAQTLFQPGKQLVRRIGSQDGQAAIEFIGSGLVTYRVPSGFRKLNGEVVLKPSGNRFTPAEVSIELENRTLWEATLREPRSPQSFDLQIAPDRRLTLRVKAIGESGVGHVVHFQDVRLMK